MKSISLDTKRLTVRTLEASDGKLVSQFYSDNLKHLSPWEPKGNQALADRQAAEDAVVRWMGEYEALQAIRFVARLRERPEAPIVGFVNYTQIHRGAFQACYLGFKLAEEYQGQGYMTEALSSTIDHMFVEQGLHRIMAAYMPGNCRSQSVLDRMQFEREGYAKGYLFIDGKWQDHVLTARLAPQA